MRRRRCWAATLVGGDDPAHSGDEAELDCGEQEGEGDGESSSSSSSSDSSPSNVDSDSSAGSSNAAMSEVADRNPRRPNFPRLIHSGANGKPCYVRLSQTRGKMWKEMRAVCPRWKVQPSKSCRAARPLGWMWAWLTPLL